MIQRKKYLFVFSILMLISTIVMADGIGISGSGIKFSDGSILSSASAGGDGIPVSCEFGELTESISAGETKNLKCHPAFGSSKFNNNNETVPAGKYFIVTGISVVFIESLSGNGSPNGYIIVKEGDRSIRYIEIENIYQWETNMSYPSGYFVLLPGQHITGLSKDSSLDATFRIIAAGLLKDLP